VVVCALFFWFLKETQELWGWRIGVFGLAVVLVIVLAILLTRRRSINQEALLRCLAIAAGRALPLHLAIEAIAGQFNPRYRRRVLRVAGALSWGEPLPQALKQSKVVPLDALVLIRAGWESGAPAGALREAANAQETRQRTWSALVGRLAYILFVLWFIQAIATYIMTRVAPRLEAICRSYSIEVPELTSIAFAIGHEVAPLWPLAVVMLVVELLLIVVLPFGLKNSWSWNIPLVGRFFVQRHSALILRALAGVVEAGRPLTTGLEALARDYPTRWVRRRLSWVLRDLNGGADWCAALRVRGLVRPGGAAVLDAARRAGNVAWALRETAENGERRLAYRLRAWLQVLFPLAVIGMGALVFLFAIVYFTPLVRLIEGMIE
jgi:type II secretory pathway component PulF